MSESWDQSGLVPSSIVSVLSVQNYALQASPPRAAIGLSSLLEDASVPPADDGNHKWFWLLGVLATLLGATLTTVGLLLQKRSHLIHTPEVAPRYSSSLQGAAGDHEARTANGSRGSSWAYWMRGPWIIGLGFWLLGNVVCWLGLGMAPQSIVSVMDCWNIVVALAIAPWCFGEPVSRLTFWASGLLITGTLWVIAFGPRHYEPETVENLLAACSDSGAHIAVMVTSSFLLYMGATAYSNWERTPPLSSCQYVLTSATFAWYATILSKSTAALILTSVADSETKQLQSALFWVFSVAFLFCAACQIHFLNLGMKYGDAVIVIPSYMALSMLGQIVVGGLIFFREFKYFTAMDEARFWPGVLFVLLGVAILTSQEKIPNKSNGDEGAPDERAPFARVRAAYSAP